MWTNKALKSFLDKNKGRVCSIHLNNGKVLMIDYPGKHTTKFEDIRFETVDGVDLMVVKHVDDSSGREVEFETYSTTEFIEGIDVMSEKDQMYRVDPLRFH